MSAFFLISLSILAATGAGFVARAARQPLLVGYLFAGALLGFLGVFQDGGAKLLDEFASIGVALLLFLVGLEMNVNQLPTVGRAALATGISQIIFTLAGGFLLAQLLGFSAVASLYIAIALAFSSTIIIVKLLSEKQDLSSLYGKISVGFLLVQDLVAILILVFLSGFAAQEIQALTFFWVLVKGLLLIGSTYVVSKYILNKIFDKIAKLSGELLFIASLAWALVFATFSSLPQIGFGLEIGGFLAGIALSGSSEHLQIASRVRPLRDFFITIFFLLLGAKFIGITGGILLPAVIFSIFVLVGNPLIVMAVMGFLGYKKRTSFMASLTVAQISEFSLILAVVGQRLGHIDASIVGLIALVAAVTMTLSSYLILYNHKLYNRAKSFLGLFERRRPTERALEPQEEFGDHIILFGAGRTGQAILPALVKLDPPGGEASPPVLVIDFDPQVVEKLVAEGYKAFYGDATDSEVLDAVGIDRAKLIISTTGSLEDDLFILERVRGKSTLVIFFAENAHDALRLYEAGADYVVVSRVVGGEHLAHILAKDGLDKVRLKELRDRHFDRLAKERW